MTRFRYGWASRTSTVSTDAGVEYIIFWPVYGTVLKSVTVTTEGGIGTWHS